MSMSHLEGAKALFLRNLDKLEGNDLTVFMEWAKEVIHESQYGSDIPAGEEEEKANSHDHHEHTNKGEKGIGALLSIIDELRDTLPIDAMAPSEKTTIPDDEEHEDYTDSNTVHVDSFLYDDEEVDRLCDEGKMSRAICNECGSTNTSMLNFISHSVSLSQLQFIYNYALPDLSGMTVLDVGSRTGAVLYGGYHFSKAKKLIGVEMSSYFASISSKLVKKRGMDDRVSVIDGDIRKHADSLEKANVVVLNNVFQFFHSTEQHADFWVFLRRTINLKGTYLVTVPAVEDSLRSAKLDLDTSDWLKEIPLDYSQYDDDDESDIRAVHVYQVLGTRQ
eukprot:CFRG7948T1